ncbi:SRPBCC family protein [Alkalicoccus halolimnae]|uniref:SRPBCC domain-containing protein n=1 Tax=Alkalicoccus halolimnae TaxID=1667239 RepID=A0A5C7F1R4_9BACI|nr:SRPBCC domain-containing protein [Alkalicoccus halolimnae]TXF83681.1 SRPBCC domain-containing protein [Alkalicoccus halolimnae]
MSESLRRNNTKSREEGRNLIIERTFNVSKDMLFQIYSSSAHLEQWWGPRGWETTNYKFDFRPEGVWHYCMRCADESQGEFYGQEAWGKGIFKEIVENEKIVYTDMFSDKEGNMDDRFPSVLVTIMFKEADAGSVLHVYSEFPTKEDMQKLKDMGMVEGFTSQLDRLEEYLDEIS